MCENLSIAASNPVVLFLCSHNSARSQMAEAFLKCDAGDRLDVYSAGLAPRKVHPLAVRVMREVGIDIGGQHSKSLREFLGRLHTDLAIIVCEAAEDTCPSVWPGAATRLVWPFEDPAGCGGTEQQRLVKFRAVRDQIRDRILLWLNLNDRFLIARRPPDCCGARALSLGRSFIDMPSGRKRDCAHGDKLGGGAFHRTFM